MKKNVLAIVSLLMVMTSSAYAATLSITPTGTYPTAVGDTVNFDVIFTADADGDMLYGGTLQLGYDASEMRFESYKGAQGMVELFGPMRDVVLADGTSCLANYNRDVGLGVPPMTIAANESFTFGTFTFEVTDGLVEDGFADLWVLDIVEVDIYKYTSKIAFNDNLGVYVSEILTNEAADLSAVPVPSALWLLGAGLLGLARIRRNNG